MVAVVQNGGSDGVRVQRVELSQVLQDDADRDIPRADDGDDLVKILNAGVGGEVVQNESYRYLEASRRRMVGVLAERLQCLYIEEIDYLVGVAVRVADIQKDDGFLLADSVQIDSGFLLAAENILNFPGVKDVQGDGDELLDAGPCAVGVVNLAEHFVFLCRVGAGVVLAPLLNDLPSAGGVAELPVEIYHGDHVVLFGNQRLQGKGHQKGDDGLSRGFPEGIAHIFDGTENFRNGQDILGVVLNGFLARAFLFPDVVEGIVSRGLFRFDEIQKIHLVPCAPQLFCRCAVQLPLGVCDDQASVAAPDIRDHIASGFPAAGAADDQIVVV